MEIINGKLEDNNFVVNSMEQMSKKFSISCQHKYPGKDDIRTDIQQKILMARINTPDDLESNSLIPVKHSSRKSASRMFVVLM